MSQMSATAFAAQEPQLKVQAESLGLDWPQVVDLVKKWGPQLLVVFEQFIIEGFSVDWLIQTVTKVGLPMLEALLKWIQFLNTPAAQALGASNEGVADDLITKLLPWALETYGIQLLKAIIPDQYDHLVDLHGQNLINFLLDLIKTKSAIQAKSPAC